MGNLDGEPAQDFKSFVDEPNLPAIQIYASSLRRSEGAEAIARSVISEHGGPLSSSGWWTVSFSRRQDRGEVE